MKNYLITNLIILILNISTLLSTQENEQELNKFAFGFELLGVFSINTISTPDRINHPKFSSIPNFSLSFDYPLTKNSKQLFKTILSFGDISEKIELNKPIQTELLIPIESKYDLTIYYFGIQLEYVFYNFGFGIGFRYPLSGRTEYYIDKENLAHIFNFHIAYYLPLFISQMIEFEIVTKINFALSGQLKNYPTSDPFFEFEMKNRSPLTKQYNPLPISFGIGLLVKYNFLQ